MKLLLALALSGFCFESSSAHDQPTFAELRIHDGFITSQGVWVPDSTNEPATSVTDLECYRTGGKFLVGSDAYCMEATARTMGGVPTIEVEYHPVIEWNKDRIIAADSSTSAIPICVWTQITINLNDQTVIATDTRKLGKGHEGLDNACLRLPLVQTYHLIDQVAAFTHHPIQSEKK